MHRWQDVKKNLRKNSDNTYDYRCSNNTESWHLTFTEAQVKALDYFAFERGIEYFRETNTGAYDLVDYDEGVFTYTLYPKGHIKTQVVYTYDSDSLDELIQLENE